MKLIDLTGRSFGKLRVLRRSEGPDKSVWWECQCDCGAITSKRSSEIRTSKASCGCLSREIKKAKRLPDDRGLWRQAIRKYQRNARERGLDWALSDDAAIALMKEDCGYCKTPPGSYVRHSKDASGRFILRNGIDRIENDQGYVTGNVLTCCRDCNIAKGAMSSRDFLVWVHRVARFTQEPAIDDQDVSPIDLDRHPVIADVLALCGGDDRD